ncbi:thioredoxin-dependent thiol peroxidase [Aliarcobacter thereius]|uniref:thioredoxin-dependent peroxiredoxin n=2 Tax=Aliarcobacter thereius TaxID=544718 RepID=A0A1C7WPV9_9BACT|nr:thioredoxin-dependent thiol peroxidase [Aliarcobacter thereius]OCL90442.1 putative peroxiredoxin bcp [Aliarcobacter thereius]OCL95796.1 putative peroxiredoxin bcp [Aliarcobacter thereius LMG 24486]OCL98383.1 putative peroxiredoxin bcp [Aliarcobacter thereius]QBF16230.1 thiol peroxidase [Aliarcobacter thereius LMG 24486]TLS71009.1 thioredoxin-dependent thiol peroxidase [Aliarcobacter thereius]
MLEIGKVAPDFCAFNQDDTEICLRDIKGNWIVLYFYPKDMTPGCTTQACDFSSNLYLFDSLKASIIGVSADSSERHRKFIEKYDLSISLLADEDKKMCQDYGVWQLKKFMGKEFMGIVRTTFIINPKGEIAHIWDKVSVRKKVKKDGKQIEILHVDEVKNKLEELQSVYK